MITPVFRLTQDDDFVTLSMKCPLMRAQDIEYTIDPHEFYFYAKPYFLRLHFTQRLIQDGREKGTFDIESNEMIFLLPKETKGDYFPDLDLLSNLLAVPKRPTEVVTEIPDEIIDISHVNFCNDDEESEHEGMNNVLAPQPLDETLLELEQTLPETREGSFRYGFNSQYNNYFTNYPEDMLFEVLDITNPDGTLEPVLIRELTFDEDYYMSDYQDAEGHIKYLLSLPPPLADTIDDITFTEADSAAMVALRPKTFEAVDSSVYFGLLDLVLSYCYEYRITEGEHNVESSWMLSKLASTFCCLARHNSVESVISSFMQRSLCLPLYRNFELSCSVIQDASLLFLKGGRRALLKVLLDMKRVFDGDETRHIFSKLFLNDYCLWLQKAPNTELHRIGKLLQHARPQKADLPWPLAAYEALVDEYQDDVLQEEIN